MAFWTSTADDGVTTAAGVSPLKLVLKTLLAEENCPPLSGRITWPLIAAARSPQPDGSALARLDPNTAPAANAPIAPRRNV